LNAETTFNLGEIETPLAVEIPWLSGEVRRLTTSQ